MTSTTKRTMDYLRSDGWSVTQGQRFNPWSKTFHDLFGFGDLLAFKPGDEGPTLIQCTSGENHAHRREKILSLADALGWLESGGKILIVSWQRRGARGKRKLWEPRLEWVEQRHFGSGDEPTPEGVEEVQFEEG